MSDTNTVVLTGNLTRDPELRYTPKGVAVANVGLASNRKYRQGDEIKDEACFVDVTVFGSTAEAVAKYLDKGRKVLIEGRLRHHTWETEGGSQAFQAGRHRRARQFPAARQQERQRRRKRRQ